MKQFLLLGAVLTSLTTTSRARSKSIETLEVSTERAENLWVTVSYICKLETETFVQKLKNLDLPKLPTTLQRVQAESPFYNEFSFGNERGYIITEGGEVRYILKASSGDEDRRASSHHYAFLKVSQNKLTLMDYEPYNENPQDLEDRLNNIYIDLASLWIPYQDLQIKRLVRIIRSELQCR